MEVILLKVLFENSLNYAGNYEIWFGQFTHIFSTVKHCCCVEIKVKIWVMFILKFNNGQYPGASAYFLLLQYHSWVIFFPELISTYGVWHGLNGQSRV
jgi:hypothetical protein